MCLCGRLVICITDVVAVDVLMQNKCKVALIIEYKLPLLMSLQPLLLLLLLLLL